MSLVLSSHHPWVGMARLTKKLDKLKAQGDEKKLALTQNELARATTRLDKLKQHDAAWAFERVTRKVVATNEEASLLNNVFADSEVKVGMVATA